MPLYKYKVMNKQGRKMEGTFSANSKNEVLAMIRENEYLPILVEEVVTRKEIQVKPLFSKVKMKDLAIFCRQFYTMLSAGATVVHALDVLKQQAENQKLKIALTEIYEGVQKGETLSESFHKYPDVFPVLLTNMIASGEATGNLDTILGRMADHYERENKIRHKVQNAMIYPILLSVVAMGVVGFLMTFVMPNFVSMFEQSGVALPVPTKILLQISEGIRNRWYLLPLPVFLVMGIFHYVRKTKKGSLALEKGKLHFPILKEVQRKMILARFTRGLSTILYSGIPLVQALEIVGKILGNTFVEEQVLQAKEKVVKGVPLGEALIHIEVFPPMLLSMVKIGEESGALDSILEKTAQFYEEELETALQKLTTMVEPVLILIMGVLIGAIVISMLLPMFNMFNTVGGI